MRLLAHAPPKRIAVFRALQLGDMLVAVPALRALRAACPGAAITLIGLPWARDFAARVPYVDDFIAFPGYPGLPERVPDFGALPGFFAAAQAREFDLAIQLHGSGAIVNRLVRRLGARRTAGFVASPGADPDEPPSWLPWPEPCPEVHRYLRLMAFLGAPPQGDGLELPVYEAERAAAAALQSAHGLRPRAYACVHPGARLASRRWPVERFAAVADGIAAAGYAVVLTAAPSEAALTCAVRVAMRRPAIDLAGETSLGALAALVAEAALVVSNDTGMSHVAAATRTPSVIVSCGADAVRWQPVDTERHRVLWHDVPCRPCAHDACPTRHECADGVTVAAVARDVAKVLMREHAHAP